MMRRWLIRITALLALAVQAPLNSQTCVLVDVGWVGVPLTELQCTGGPGGDAHGGRSGIRFPGGFRFPGL